MEGVVRLDKQGLALLIENIKANGGDATELENLMAEVSEDEKARRPVRRMGNPLRILVEEPTTEERLETEVGELFPEGTQSEKGELINMAQYDPLRDYLSEYKGNELTLTFKEIDNIIVPKALPPCAYNLRQFWQNSYSPGRRHVQATAWHNARWKVSKVVLQRQIVTLCRRLNEYEATP